MKYNINLVKKYAKSAAGEQTELLCTDDLLKEPDYSSYKACADHGIGMPVSTYRNENGELYIIQRDGLCHALVTGSTGCGKSMRYLENCLFNLGGTVSVIIVDVKGELYRNTATYLKGVYGEENVKYMNFIKPSCSQIFFNPIYECALKYYEAELLTENKEFVKGEALSELRKLYEQLFPIRTKYDLSWDTGARDFIYGITYGLFEDMFLTRQQEKATGRKRVLPEQINFKTISEIFSRFQIIDSDFEDHGFFSSRDKKSDVLRFVSGIINNAPNTRASYLQLVHEYLNGYSYPDVRALTIADNFDITTMGDKPQVIFLTYDITEEKMRSLVNQYIIRSLGKLRTKAVQSGEPLKVPVQYFLDEFPTLQANDIYPTIFSVGRGLNIYITAIVQDFTQLETTYSCGVAQQIRSNCNLTFFLGTNDINTARSVKAQIGNHVTYDMAEYLQGRIRFAEMPLVSEDALMHRIKAGETYIMINNHMPVKGYFDLYYDCPEYTRYPKIQGCGTSNPEINSYKYNYDFSLMDTYNEKHNWWD